MRIFLVVLSISISACFSLNNVRLPVLNRSQRDLTMVKIKCRRAVLGSLLVSLGTLQQPANAAPPIEVIAEELGYFPIQTSPSLGTIYSPARIKNASTEQAVRLSQHLEKIGAKFYGAFWCPHCLNQRMYFGSEALKSLPYVEVSLDDFFFQRKNPILKMIRFADIVMQCASQGLDYDQKQCQESGVYKSGFPTWVINGKSTSGEMNLERLAQLSNFPGSFDPKLEVANEKFIRQNSGSCKL